MQVHNPASATAGNARRTALLTIGAIGVVYGDIGTSPLYAYREALAQSLPHGVVEADILGVLSLTLWALILVVTVKYILFLMRMDNKGEGGVLSLMALTQFALQRWKVVTILGAAGAALFYGDAILTPALSVLSAVEGLKTVPGIGSHMDESTVVVIALVILISLFAIQGRGTEGVSRIFGPVCVLWFLAIGAVGAINLVEAPHALAALNPEHAILFLSTNGMTSLKVLGAVFLTVTGAEALTADMGHFGRFPVRLGWLALVFPALAVNYLGQGAFTLTSLETATAAGTVLEGGDWFFLMVPESVRLAMVVLATFATIIASQAVITGAFSLTRQGIALGFFPRMQIRQTSEAHEGQIYIPAINWLLLAGVAILIISFRNSSSLAAAYGIAVSGTMMITTCLAFFVMWKVWRWHPLWAATLALPFILLDAFFFGANMLRVLEGGWMPLTLACAVGVTIYVWRKGRAYMAAEVQRATVSMQDIADALASRPPLRVPGTAVFLTAEPDVAPVALLHNLKHNKVLHERNVIATVRGISTPRVDVDKRLILEPIDANFQRATLNFGYMETPDVPSGLFGTGAIKSDLAGASFFVGRHILSIKQNVGLPLWQDLIFVFLQRNASDPNDFFQIPPGRVVEIGTRMEI